MSNAQPLEVADDAAMGAELTVQYHRACGGMREVVRFGAMMMKLREMCDSTRGVAKLGNEARRDTGVKAWLATHAPEVKEATAYRFLGVTEGIVADYQNIVGAKTAKLIDLPTLVNTPTAELPAPLQAKQLELFGYLDGTSQRSWLDKIRPAKFRGGNKHPKCGACGGNLRNHAQECCPHCAAPTGAPPPDPNRDPKQEEAIDLWTPVLFALRLEGIEHQSFAHLPDKGPVSRETLRGLLTDVSAKLRAMERTAA